MAIGSASKVHRVRRCEHAFYFSDLLGLERKKKSIAPSRGILIHDCLQAHYSGQDWTKPISDLTIEWENLFDEERAEWGDLPKEAYRIMRGYLMAFKTADSTLKTLATEVEFEFELEGHTYVGFIDWIYEDERGDVWVVDHKTTKTLPSETDLYMDMQTLLYYEACRKDTNLIKLLEGKRLAGVVFNHIRTKAPREPQLLKNGSVSKAAIDTDVATYFNTVKQHGLDPNDYKDMLEKLEGKVFFRRTKIPVSENTLATLKKEVVASLNRVDELTEAFEKDPNTTYPRTLLKGRCSWDCEFSSLCFAELAGMNISGIIEEDFIPRTSRKQDSEVESD